MKCLTSASNSCSCSCSHKEYVIFRSKASNQRRSVHARAAGIRSQFDIANPTEGEGASASALDAFFAGEDLMLPEDLVVSLQEGMSDLAKQGGMGGIDRRVLWIDPANPGGGPRAMGYAQKEAFVDRWQGALGVVRQHRLERLMQATMEQQLQQQSVANRYALTNALAEAMEEVEVADEERAAVGHVFEALGAVPSWIRGVQLLDTRLEEVAERFPALPGVEDRRFLRPYGPTWYLPYSLGPASPDALAEDPEPADTYQGLLGRTLPGAAEEQAEAYLQELLPLWLEGRLD